MSSNTTQGKEAGKDQAGGGSEAKQVMVAVPLETLQAWALDLSQGDTRFRWNLEDVITDAGHPLRARDSR